MSLLVVHLPVHLRGFFLGFGPGIVKRGFPCIKLSALSTALELSAERNWRVSSKTLSHVDQAPPALAASAHARQLGCDAALALPVSLLELQAPRRQCFDERISQAVARLISLNKHAVGVLEAFGKSRS